MTENLYDAMLLELKRRRVAYLERYVPYYLCSIGAHLFNLHNQRAGVLYKSGLLMNTRVHLMLVSPPGYSKTFWLRQFLDEKGGLLKRTGLKCGFEGAMTEAGFVGTIRFAEGGIATVTKGAAAEYKEGIFGVEEFAALSEAMKASYSRTMRDAFLTGLDSGRLVKRLAAGVLTYKTQVTIWAGTQVMRFDVASGLARRFVFLLFLPTRVDQKLLKTASREGINVTYDNRNLNALRRAFDRLMIRVNGIKEVEISSSVFSFLDQYRIFHYEEDLYIRLMIGYLVMKGQFDEKLTVYLDDNLKRIIKQEVHWREQIKRGSQSAQVLTVLRENNSEMGVVELKDALLAYGLDWTQSQEIISRMVKEKILILQDGKVKLKRRKK